MDFAQVILQKRLDGLFAVRRAAALTAEALARMEDGIVILPRFAPWKSVLSSSPAEFVVYPSQRGGWTAQAVPEDGGGGTLKTPFPAEWTGCPEETLPAVSGVPELTFCHNGRFLIAAQTRDGAVAACRAARREGRRKADAAPMSGFPECDAKRLTANLEKLHTTELGAGRLKSNLSLGDTDDVVSWCREKIRAPHSKIRREGKNWYILADGCEITVNARSYTIITAHQRTR